VKQGGARLRSRRLRIAAWIRARIRKRSAPTPAPRPVTRPARRLPEKRGPPSSAACLGRTI